MEPRSRLVLAHHSARRTLHCTLGRTASVTLAMGSVVVCAVVLVCTASVTEVSPAFLVPSSSPARSLRHMGFIDARWLSQIPCMPNPAASYGLAWVASLAGAAVCVYAAIRRQPLRCNSPGTSGVLAALPTCRVPCTPSRKIHVSQRAWPWEDDDPYSRCTALQLQIGLQFSKPLLESLNRLAETADASTDEGLHQLLLDVVLALRRAQSSWRYGRCERLTFDADDGAREAGTALQKWGIQFQSKYGDGEDYSKMDKRGAPTGITEYLVVSMYVSCWGVLCREEEGDLKVRKTGDVIKVLDALSGVQVDELMQLDVQWRSEEVV